MSRILIVEPDDSMRRAVREHLEKLGYSVFEAPDSISAELLLADRAFDVVVGDADVHEGRLLDLVFESNVGGTVALLILLTNSTLDTTNNDSVSGPAFDYLQKPFEMSELEGRVDRAIEFKRMHYEAQDVHYERTVTFRPENFVGESDQIRQVLGVVSKVAATDSSVLITGETGTGKELVAGAVHFNSGRAGNAFIKVNCAALPDDLLESELFGHEKGAFTGAAQRRIGRFEQADGGTIFLDEIGDMSLLTQAKVLRVLQEKEFERLGGSATISSDVRIVCATNKDLPAAIERGEFRQDLYYRINVVSIRMPPLREREEDVVPLVYHFLRKFAADLKKGVKRIHPLAIEVLKDHAFPGNVRELQNIIERGVLMCDGDEITVQDLDITFQKKGEPANENVVTIPPSGFDLKQVEKSYILQALKLCDWNQKEASKLLNVSPRALNYKIKNHEIKHPSWTHNRPIESRNR